MTGVDVLDVPLRPSAAKYCQRCGSRFTPVSTVGRPPKYCGENCQKRAAQEAKDERAKAKTAAQHAGFVATLAGRTCEAPNCTNELPAPKLHAAQAVRFCSGACRVRAHRAAKRQVAA